MTTKPDQDPAAADAAHPSVESEPTSHAPPRPETTGEVERRRFLVKASVGLAVVGGVTLSVPGLGFILAPLFRASPRQWRAVGQVESFEVGTTSNVVFVDASPLPWAGVTAKTGAWLRRTAAADFTAFSVNCSHLGCPVRWLQTANLFMCPCHGGVYYADGRVAAGPPPRPLTRYPVRIHAGQVEILTQPIPIG